MSPIWGWMVHRNHPSSILPYFFQSYPITRFFSPPRFLSSRQGLWGHTGRGAHFSRASSIQKVRMGWSLPAHMDPSGAKHCLKILRCSKGYFLFLPLLLEFGFSLRSTPFPLGISLYQRRHRQAQRVVYFSWAFSTIQCARLQNGIGPWYNWHRRILKFEGWNNAEYKISFKEFTEE